MSKSTRDTRLFLLGNPDKPSVETTIEDLRSFAESRCAVVGSDRSMDGRLAIDAGAERIVVLGGDGTLIGVARSLGENPIPLIGVNAGKMGFLAEFGPEELKQHFDRALGDDSLICHRTVLQVAVRRDDRTIHDGPAINDCVIHAGPPFRMVTLGVSLNGQRVTDFRGDGLVICTPSGSTAHNLSAGGPIVQPGVDAIVLTPLNPHSLTHKPIVVERETVIEVVAADANEGTTAMVDGQVSCSLAPGDRVIVKRFPADYLLVRNPSHAQWQKLVTKLHWGHAVSLD